MEQFAAILMRLVNRRVERIDIKRLDVARRVPKVEVEIRLAEETFQTFNPMEGRKGEITKVVINKAESIRFTVPEHLIPLIEQVK